MGRALSRGLRWLALVFIVLLLAVFLGGGGYVFVVEIPVLLLLGWARFIGNGWRQVEVDPVLLTEAVAVVAVLAVGTHLFAGWVYRSWRGEAASRWRWRWSLGGLAVVLLLFAAGIGTIGLTHQLAWLLGRGDPFLYDTFRARLIVQEASSIAGPAKAELEIACREGRLAGAGRHSLGLAAPAHEHSVVLDLEARGIDETTARIVLTLKAHPPYVREGEEIVYTGTCAAQAMRWEVSDTSRYFLPRS